MKRFYFLLPDLSAGGAERVIITIARLLKKEGKNVVFLNLGYPEGEMKSWIIPEFELISLNSNHVTTAFFKLYNFLRNKSNIVLFSSREHQSVIAMIVAKLLKIPIIVRIPNMPKNKLATTFINKTKSTIIRFLNKILLNYAQKVIAQNSEMAEQLQKTYKLSQNRIIVINNPIDKEFVLKSAEGTENPFNIKLTNFLSVCNISYAKGIDILFDAFKIVSKQIPNVHLTIVGRTSSEYAKSLLANTNIPENITIAGFKTNPYPYIKHCNVFVLPSRMEGFPNVVLEAMCFNKPIASTTCVSVIKDIITPKVNGYYCDIEDPQSLANTMIEASKLTNISNNYTLFDKNKLLTIFE